MSEFTTITKVTIRNVKGIEFLSFIAGQINVLSGKNGVGKSSVLDAIQGIFDGGHDPGLIRNGAEKADVELHLSEGSIIRKITTQKQSVLNVITNDGGIVRSPKSFVEDLAVSFAYDPLALVTAKPAERMRWLLEHMPIEFTGAELNDALKIIKYRDHERITLDRLNQLAEGIRSTRTDVNRKARDREGMLRRQQEAIGEDDGTDWKARLAELSAEQSSLEKDIAAGKAQVEAQAERLRGERRQKAQEEIQAIKDRLASELAEIDSQAADVLKDGQAEATARLSTIAVEIATANEKHAQQLRNAGARQNLEQIRKEMSEANAQAFDLSNQLEAIDKLKRTKLSDIPIPGLDIKDGEIYVDGVPWEHLNTSSQDIVSMQIGAMGLRKLPLMILERSEHVDDERWANVMAGLRDAGIQVFAERVTAKEDLTLTADDAERVLAGGLFPEPATAYAGDPGDRRRGRKR